MRFQEAYAGCQDKRLTQQDAGQLLGVSECIFRRQIGRFEADGMQGLVDLRMSQVSSRRAPVDEVLGLQRLYGVPPQVGMGAIRFSLGRYTTEAEIDAVTDRLATVVDALRDPRPVFSANWKLRKQTD